MYSTVGLLPSQDQGYETDLQLYKDASKNESHKEHMAASSVSKLVCF